MDIDISNYLDKLSEIYKEIDSEYEKTQKHYDNFSCKDCDDNCCTTVFHHYTFIENLFMIEGFDTVEPERWKVINERAKDYFTQLTKSGHCVTSLKIMCPLNFDGLCSLYEYRPLICRIHGVPSFLQSPHRGKQEWQGCKRFEKLHGDKIDSFMDRTPYFTKIATLEGQVRQELTYFQKHRKTIAEMIMDYSKEEITLVKEVTPGDFHKDSHII